MESKDLQYIGIVHGDILSLEDAPKNFSESQRHGRLEIFPEFTEGLKGIAAGQKIVVLFWLHKSERNILQVHPRGDKSREKRGVFSTRSPARPNPIGISELRVEQIDGNRLDVSGLDILNGTPVIDIKNKIEP